MNANIKQINDHILEVDFRLIPMISDISFKQTEGDCVEEVPALFSNDGRVLLNTYSELYEAFKVLIIMFDKYSDRELIDIKDSARQPCANELNKVWDWGIRSLIGKELERRKLFKKCKKRNRLISLISWKG